MTEQKQCPKFEICLDDTQLSEILATGKLSIICTHDCPCYDKTPKASQIFNLESTKPITARDVVDFLIQINYSPLCSHRYLESFKWISPNLYTPVFNSWRM